VEVRACGPRISLPGKAMELGASYALECGADGIVVSYPGAVSLKTIASMLSVPWLLKPSSPEEVLAEWTEARGSGASGLWLDHNWLVPGGSLLEVVENLRAILDERSANG
jgi:hypothetical protein